MGGLLELTPKDRMTAVCSEGFYSCFYMTMLVLKTKLQKTKKPHLLDQAQWLIPDTQG
jgi:hypothetical protein